VPEIDLLRLDIKSFSIISHEFYQNFQTLQHEAMPRAGNQIDELDRKIILELQEDARKPYKEIAKKLKVSEGTIKNRVGRLVDNGILKLQARVDPFAFPHKIAALVGVRIKGREHEETMARIAKVPCVTSIWNATGRYDLFFELMVDSLEDLNDVLYRNVLRDIKGILNTETFVTLWSETKFYRYS
jgi:Lrp/AsnC family transcriptional regulator for asnA, asnC and gidA